MFSLKRSVIAALVIAMTLAGLGVTSASASTDAPDQLLRQQAAEAAWLGVNITDTDDGVMITQVVPDSPADEAGLQRGDIVTAVDETEIDTADLLIETIQAHAPGDEIELAYTRDDESETVSVTLAERPAELGVRPFAQEPRFFGTMNLLGLNAEMTEDGIVIESIDPDSPFADSGLEPGDLITAINGDSTTEGMIPGMAFGHIRFGEPVVFSVLRDGEEIEITVELDASDFPSPVTPPDMDLQIQPVRPTQLGVQFQTIDADLVEQQSLDVDQGALIVEVYEDTPAAAADLQVDDIILAVDGDMVDEEHTLADRLVAYEEGDVVTLLVLRDGEEIEVEVELGPPNTSMQFSGPVQVMPMQPGQQGYRFGPGMRQNHPYNNDQRPFHGQQRGFFGMGPGMNFFFHGQPGRFFQMPHDFFFDGHRFWGNGDETAPKDDDSTQTEPETSDDTQA
jgi:S1-C subfamily serine protease